MPDKEGGRLNSWKAIARHLGRDVRTAMRWEKEAGMPIHRIPGPRDGRSVFAYVAELDTWLSGLGEQAPTQSVAPGASTAGRDRRWATGLALVLVTAMATTTALRLTPQGDELEGVARVVATGDALTAHSAQGNLLWTVRHPEGRSFRDGSQIFHKMDRSGGAGRVALFAANTDAAGDRGFRFGELWSISETGEIQWNRSVEEVIHFGERSFSGPWMSRFLHVVSVDGEDVILWGLHHTTWWPSLVLMLTPDGAERGRFVSSGWVTSATSVPSAEGDLLLVSGVSNSQGAGVLAVLPGADFSGSSLEEPGSQFTCLDCPPGRPLRYLVFPPTDVNRASGLPYNQAMVGLSDDGIIVQVLEGPTGSDGQWVYEFTPELELRHVTPGDSYWLSHDLLEEQGKIDHPSAECPERNGFPILSWTPQGGWIELTPTVRGSLDASH